jgi:hypothetical protein
VREAYQLIKDLEPAVPQEYILKGVVNAAMGQENGSVCPLPQLTLCFLHNHSLFVQFLNFKIVRSKTLVNMLMNGIFCDVTPYGCCENSDFVFLRSMRQLLVMANVPSSPILVTLMKEVLSSSETSVLTRAAWHNIPEDDILHSHRNENLQSYIALTGWAM